MNGDGYSDVLVGAPDYDDGQEDEGAVFLYLGSSVGLSTSPARLWQRDQAGARFGASVSGAGNVNADGFDDVLIGAPGFDEGEMDEGAAFLFLGAASELPDAPAWSAEGNQEGASFGSSVAALGDMNGDGFGDVVISAPLFDGGHVDEGQARVFGGTSSGLGTSSLQSFEANEEGGRFGHSVAGAGNLSGDGNRRILFGAPIYTYTHAEEGGTWFASLGQAPFFLDFGRQDFAHRGVSIASGGDVNADGLMDVVIGADGFDAGEEDEGVVTVHQGHPSFVVDRTPAWSVDGNQPFCAFGFSVAFAGDVNGDNFDDVVIGAPQYDRGQIDEGRAFLFLGPSGTTVGVGGSEVPSLQRLHFSIEPNPISAEAEFVFDGDMQALVLEIFDPQGRLIDLLHPSGHRVRWSPSGSLPRGVYFARVQGRNISETVKFAIIR